MQFYNIATLKKKNTFNKTFQNYMKFSHMQDGDSSEMDATQHFLSSAHPSVNLDDAFFLEAKWKSLCGVAMLLLERLWHWQWCMIVVYHFGFQCICVCRAWELEHGSAFMNTSLDIRNKNHSDLKCDTRDSFAALKISPCSSHIITFPNHIMDTSVLLEVWKQHQVKAG